MSNIPRPIAVNVLGVMDNGWLGAIVPIHRQMVAVL